MPTRRHLMRKSSNIENTPISPRGASAKPTQGGMCRNGLQRIRRKVSGVKPYALTATPEHQLKKRLTKARTPQVPLPTPPATPGTRSSGTTTPVPARPRFEIPRYLKRPELKEVQRKNIVAADPDLRDVSLPFIRDNLLAMAPAMQNVLAGVQTADLPDSQLPQQLTITLNNVLGSLPTHMLAIYPRDDKTTTDRTRVTLYPIHDIVFAAHCAHIPEFSPSVKATGQLAPGTQITIPVVPFAIPHPESFPKLTSYLYNKRRDLLLSHLLCLVPSPAAPGTSKAQTQLQYSASLARTFTYHALMEKVMYVNGLWRNVCALGIFDIPLWGIFDAAWEILLCALAISSGNYNRWVASRTARP